MPRPRPNVEGFDSLLTKEENEGGIPLPRPWPCGGGEAASRLEFLDSSSGGVSTVNWKCEGAPRPLPPPPDEVERAAEIEGR